MATAVQSIDPAAIISTQGYDRSQHHSIRKYGTHPGADLEAIILEEGLLRLLLVVVVLDADAGRAGVEQRPVGVMGWMGVVRV